MIIADTGHGIILLIFIILFVPSDAVKTQNDDSEKTAQIRAEHYCRRAVEEYNADNIRLAEHFIKRCEFNSADFFASQHEALKLKALLLLRKNDLSNFIETGKRSASLVRDSTLLYMMAGASMKIKRYGEAYDLFKESISASALISPDEKNTVKPDDIFYCTLPDFRNRKIPLAPLKLHEKNLVLAKFQLMALGNILNKNIPGMQNLMDGLQKTEQNNDPILMDLLRNPENEMNHLRCIKNLEREISEKPYFMPENLKAEMNGTLILLYKNRIAFHPTAESLFSYGSALLDTGHFRESLHAFRTVLEKNGWSNISNDTFPDQKSSETLRKISIVYSRLQLKQDAVTALRLADVLDENAGMSSSDSEFRRRVLDTAGENLFNREALLLLAADAAWRKNGKYEAYMDRIAERDRKMDEVELRTLFGESFPF